MRIISATNRDLKQTLGEGRLRSDLYYRLAVFPIEVPPLRERQEDIPLLVWHFIQSRQRTLGRTVTNVPRAAMEALSAYDWPGNVRELENGDPPGSRPLVSWTAGTRLPSGSCA